MTAVQKKSKRSKNTALTTDNKSKTKHPEANLTRIFSKSLNSFHTAYLETLDDAANSLLLLRFEFSPNMDYEKINREIKHLRKKTNMLETRLDHMLIDMKQIRRQMNPLEKDINSITACVAKEFESIDFVEKVWYEYINENELQIIIVHNLDNSVKTLNIILDAMDKIRDQFPSIYFEPVLLHPSEISPESGLDTIILSK